MKKMLLLVVLPWVLVTACDTEAGAGGGTAGVTGAVPPVDSVAPAFGAGEIVTGIAAPTAIFVSWPEAVDGTTDRLLLEYRVYHSSSSNLATVADATNNGTPAMVWTRNIQEWLVTGLAPTNTYYFTVLVRDQAGNIAAHVPVAASTALPGGLVKTVLIAGQQVRFRYCPGGFAPLVSDGDVGYVAPFWIAEMEMTYGLWHVVYTWATNNGYIFAYPGQEGSSGVSGAAPTLASNQPAVNMCWRDALVWCNAASEMAGISPAYLSNASGPVVRRSTNRTSNINGLDNAYTDPASEGFRFPLQNEWMCAARYRDGVSWTPGSYASGTWGVPNFVLTNYAWYTANAGGASHEVGQLLSNELGCHDMNGNAGEFFFSTAQYYQKAASSWYTVSSCPLNLSTTRYAYERDQRFGFRLAIAALP